MKSKQRGVVNHEQRRPQDAHQCNVVVGLGKPCEEVGEVEYLLAGEKSCARRGAVRHPVALHGLLKMCRLVKPAQQHRHIRRLNGRTSFVSLSHIGVSDLSNPAISRATASASILRRSWALGDASSDPSPEIGSSTR